MRRRPMMLSAVTRGDRHQTTADIDAAVSSAGGWIVDHALFSNIAASIRFAVPLPGLAELRRRLVAANVGLDEESLAALDACPAGEDEISVTLSVTFVHDEPDLRREIPAVPG